MRLEDEIAAQNPGLEVPRGLISHFSGVKTRHMAPVSEQPSDLAVAAARRVLTRTGTGPEQVDLLVYAGVCIDAIEPATAHIVSAKLGLGCRVLDIRNACNSVCDAIDLADSFIATGRHRKVLIACGETSTVMMPRTVADHQAYKDAAAAYTLSDAGAALLLEAGTEPGLLVRLFMAHSAVWDAAAVPLVRGPEGLRTNGFTVDGRRLGMAFTRFDPRCFTDALAGAGLSWDDVAAVCIHQAALPALWPICDYFGIAKDKVVVSIADHGNVASVTLLLQLAQAIGTGCVKRGDVVALIGLGSGISASLMVFRW
ncbi:3-oxoacyl-[acyl-carrier-protein] synthase III C-terminal domain-containing protein [Nonomuraea sp. NPDC050404]|uniref:3-oxoacyl-ACP synthase III family protein n=1 Tax=Nonomuraea sp. NPDC050404 TaxID=3155783 RepID=UPI0033FF868F